MQWWGYRVVWGLMTAVSGIAVSFGVLAWPGGFELAAGTALVALAVAVVWSLAAIPRAARRRAGRVNTCSPFIQILRRYDPQSSRFELTSYCSFVIDDRK